MSIPVLRPTIDEQTKQELIEVLDNGWWGNGPKVKEFEKKFAEYVGTKYAVACVSCTAALDLCLKAYNIQGGELITTPMTFVSDAIVGEWNGMDVTFCDIKDDLCLDPATIQTTSKTKAIIAVDSHGRLADIDGIRRKFNGLIIEDAAHAMYTPGVGKGDITVWSFQAVKSLPTGDGGMITTNDESIAKKIRGLLWLGIERSTFDRVGTKSYSWDYDIQHNGQKSYMIDIFAVIGLGQLRRLEQTNARRRAIQARYNRNFMKSPYITIPHYSHTVQYYTMQCEERDALSEHLGNAGISTSVHFKPLSEMTYWKKAKKNPLPMTDKIWPKLLSLPVHNALTDMEQSTIIIETLKFYENLSNRR